MTFELQTMYKIRDWCIDAVNRSISPDIGVVAESHDPRVKFLVILLFQEDREFVSKPTRLFKMSLVRKRVRKSIPGVPG